MYVLPHRIETGFYGKVIPYHIRSGQSEFRPAVRFEYPVAADIHRLADCFFIGQYSRQIFIVCTRSHGVKHGISYACIYGKFWCDGPFVPDINSRFQCFFLLKRIGLYLCGFAYGVEFSAVHFIKYGRDPEIELMFTKVIRKIRFGKNLIDIERKPERL